MRGLAAALFVCALPASASAARTLHVRASEPTTPCVGDGSDADPFVSLACAFEAGGFGPGDRILLHDSAIAYEGASSEGLVLGSGTANDPVIIEPAPGESPLVAGTLDLVDVSHWTIRGLTFVGTGCPGVDGPSAISVRSLAAPMTHIVVADNVVLDWPGRAIHLDGSGDELVEVEVVGNRIAGACGHAMWVWSVDAAKILDNDVSDVRCIVSQFSLCTECGEDSCWECGDCLDVTPEACAPEALVDYDYGGLIGLRVLADSSGVEVAFNRFHDFTDTACGADGRRATAILGTRIASNAGHIHHNLIERIAPGEADVGYGIQLMQGAEGWAVDHNVIVEAGQCGLCESDRLFYGGTGNVWAHNTVLGGEVAIDLAWAAGSQLRGNLVVGARSRAVRVRTAGTGVPALEHDVYWPLDPDAIGEWDDGGALPLDAWQATCACDEGARVGDPGLVVDAIAPVLTPAPDGAAIDAVPPGRAPYHGESADAGALEAPRALSAALAQDRPDTIVVEIENRVAPPLQGVATCTGLSVVLDDETVAPLRCEATEDEVLEILLAEPPTGAGSVAVAYADGPLADDASIGARVDAELAPFVLPVDDAGDGGEQESTTGAGSTSDAAESTGNGPELDGDDRGCRCNQGHRAVASAAAWWLALAPRRRRRRTP
jgi:hypothetical protein